MLDDVIDVFINILILPLQVVLIPIDAMLGQIPGIASVASAINAVGTFVGSIPETMASLLGVSPILWNTLFLTFILFLTVSPAIQIGKKVWAWIRP